MRISFFSLEREIKASYNSAVESDYWCIKYFRLEEKRKTVLYIAEKDICEKNSIAWHFPNNKTVNDARKSRLEIY